MSEKPTILVVDDETRAVELLVRTLRRLGRVATAASADEALPLALKDRFDLVLSDQRMPGMSGVELLGRIAEHDEHVGRILVTGYTDLDTSVDAINRGRVHAYLHKPCSPPDLLATASSVLQRVQHSRRGAERIELLSREKAELETRLASFRCADGGVQDRVELDAAVACALAPLAAEVAHQAIELRTDLASGAWVQLGAKPLPRVLDALARHTLDAMPDGGVLEVVTSVQGDDAVILVGDTRGSGAADEAGAGHPELHIARALVQLMGGTLAVGKGEGGGHCFEIRLPRAALAGE